MKTLKTVKFFWNSDLYEGKAEVVSVDSSKSPREVMEAWLNSKHRTSVEGTPKFCDMFTGNWTENTFYDITDNMIHSWYVEDFIAREL